MYPLKQLAYRVADWFVFQPSLSRISSMFIVNVLYSARLQIMDMHACWDHIESPIVSPSSKDLLLREK